MERFLKTRFVLIICLTFGLGFALSSVVQAQEEPLQGCGPGFWKHDKHFDSWVDVDPNQSFYAFFGIDEGDRLEIRVKKKDGGGTTIFPTMLQALNAPGGGINALARQTVAALLNAENPDVTYSLDTGGVIELFRLVYPDPSLIEIQKDDFETRNELGCPLNGDDV